MGTDAQDEVAAFLSSPEAYGGRVAEIEREDTHISVVFLADRRAYKMKRAVRFEYLDFSTLELRHRYCEAEVGINRRTAPELYLGVVAVTRDAGGSLALGGGGADRVAGGDGPFRFGNAVRPHGETGRPYRGADAGNG